MKTKRVIIALIIALILVTFSQTVLAVETNNTTNTDNSFDNTTSQIIEIKDKNSGELQKYIQKYGSESYGKTAFIINKVRFYSIPFCFIGIVVGALYQYILGTRRLDMKQKGFGLIISFATILLICQVLPLIYVIVVLGWRG
jgi:hypothetical protein